jgi:hypothetical protein
MGNSDIAKAIGDLFFPFNHLKGIIKYVRLEH